MEYIIDGCSLKDVNDTEKVVMDIVKLSGHELFDLRTITRAMGAYKDQELWGYFLTCSFLGVKSFHGFKFKKGEMLTQMKMARKYIEVEELQYSGYRTKQAGAVLKVLGFKDVFHINGITVAKRE